MKYIISYLAFLFIIFSCNSSNQEPWIDPVLYNHVAEFMAECERRNINYNRLYQLDSIKFGIHDEADTNSTVIGRCNFFRKYIGIHSKFKDQYLKSKVITWHELGHCVLKKKHRDDKLAIMNGILKIDDIEQYYENWNQLIVEFFKDTRKIRAELYDEKDYIDCECN